MRIVTREEFLRMPAGTVYMIPFQEDRAVGLEEGLFIKSDNVGGWTWYYTSTSDWQHDGEDFAYAFDRAKTADVPMDYTSSISHDDPRTKTFAVLSDVDVVALISALAEALLTAGRKAAASQKIATP